MIFILKIYIMRGTDINKASFPFEFLLFRPYGPIHFNFEFLLVPRLAFKSWPEKRR